MKTSITQRMYAKTCPHCGSHFAISYEDSCRRLKMECSECGNEIEIDYGAVASVLKGERG